MQQIRIALLVAFLCWLPAKTLIAANEEIVTPPKMISGLFSPFGVATTPITKTTTITKLTTVQSAIKAPSAPLTATTTITRLKPITVQMTTLPPPTKPVTVTPTTKVTATVPVKPTAVPPTQTISTTQTTTDDAAYAKAITGTIIANRTQAKLRFFVEGETYELAPVRSVGLNLPRATAVLNLYNCDANTPESKDCFWDPYLLDKDSFYEIVNGADAGKTVSLSLRQAGTPPADRIWVQNRTGKRETVFYANKVYELPPSSVEEFTAEQNSPTILLHLRSCISIGNKSACEWSPRNVQPGSYYALVEIATQGQASNSSVHNLELQSIIAPAGKAAATPSQTSALVTCRLQVPIINIRSGPGLQYQVIGKVVGSEQEPASVVVVGRDDTQQWLAVEDKVAPGGWMTASPGFLQCTGDIAALPVAKIADGRLEPTPAPAVAAVPQNDQNANTTNPSSDQTTAPSTQTQQTATQTVTNTTPAPAAPSVGPGQALLIINNGFDQSIRFTLDQIYRIEQGPSEFDLKPGQGINILVHPGQIAFSASSAWHGLAGNAEFFLDNQQSRTMWITFIPDPDGSGRWILRF